MIPWARSRLHITRIIPFVRTFVRMTSSDEHVVYEIKRLQDSIRKKWRDLKFNAARSQRNFELKYKPLIEPLKSLVQQNFVAVEPKQVVDDDETDGVATLVGTPVPTTPPPTKPQIRTPNLSVFRPRTVGMLLDSYLHFLQTDTKDEADHTYGFHCHGDEWKMGSHSLTFEDDDIYIDNVCYKGTPGLLELIFKKTPCDYTESDLESYKNMLVHTGVHKTLDGTRIKSNKGYKYTNLISVMFPSKKRKNKETHGRNVRIREDNSPSSSVSSQEVGSSQSSEYSTEQLFHTGEGLLMRLNENIIDYRYWNDPNDLVVRLRLLIASKQAGNTDHDNEIIAILQELKSVRIIRDFGSFKL